MVSGGGGGIGGATAERFAREGAKVVVADIFLERAQDVVGKIGKNAHAVYLDGVDEQSGAEMGKETIARLGRVDVLDNNHAWLMDNMPNDRTLLTTQIEVWARNLEVR